jgi:hypothetical protein
MDSFDHAPSHFVRSQRIICFSFWILHYPPAQFCSGPLTLNKGFLDSYVVSILDSYVVSILDSYVVSILDSYVVSILDSYVVSIGFLCASPSLGRMAYPDRRLIFACRRASIRGLISTLR